MPNSYRSKPPCTCRGEKGKEEGNELRREEFEVRRGLGDALCSAVRLREEQRNWKPEGAPGPPGSREG